MIQTSASQTQIPNPEQTKSQTPDTTPDMEGTLTFSPFGLRLYIKVVTIDWHLRILKTGHGMHSLKACRKTLSLDIWHRNNDKSEKIDNIDEILKGIQSNVIFTANLPLLNKYDYYDVYDEWYIVNEPSRCKFCKVVNDEYIEFCKRHEVVSKLHDILEYEPRENRHLTLYIAKDAIELDISTQKHHHTVEIYPDYAYVSFASYEFTYKNHSNASPYLSSYQVITLTVLHVVKRIYDILDSLRSNRKLGFNLELNGKTVYTASCNE